MKPLLKLSLIILLFLCFISNTAFAQEPIHKVDLKAAQKLINDSSARYGYYKLLDRFLNNDTTLSDSDYVMMYIGYALSGLYHPKPQNEMEDSISSLLRANNFVAVKALAKNYLQYNPISFSANMDLGLAYQQSKRTDSAKIYLYRGIHIFRAIAITGNGYSPDSAFIVTGGKDPYVLMGILKLHSRKTEILRKDGSSYKVMNIVMGKKQIKKMYFNVSLYEAGLLKDAPPKVMPVIKTAPKKGTK